MSGPLRVLAVEDSEDDALLLARALRDGGYSPTVERVDTREAMAQALDRQEWDLILADYTMPRFSGMDALRMVQERGLDVPFIVVSGTIGEDAAVALMRGGAHDYVRKDNLARLVPVVERETREAAVRRARRRAELERELILASAGEGIAGVDSEDKVLFINPAAARMVGWGPDELIGKPLHDMIHYSHADGTPYPWEDCPSYASAKQGTAHHSDAEVFWRRDGTSFPVEYVSTPIREGPNLVGVVVVFRDITERKHAEEELAAAHEHLLLAESEKKRFYREVIRAVTQGKLNLVDAGEIPAEGTLAVDENPGDPAAYHALREEVRQAALGAGMAPDDAEDLVLAVGEAAINAVKHAGGGEVLLYTAPDRIIARVVDHGAGIQPDQIPATLLLPGYSTTVSLGMGFTIMLQLADTVWLATGPGGTTVQMEKLLHPEVLGKRLPPPAWAEL